jgi:hypothetical protein
VQTLGDRLQTVRWGSVSMMGTVTLAFGGMVISRDPCVIVLCTSSTSSLKSMTYSSLKGFSDSMEEVMLMSLVVLIAILSLDVGD